MDKQNKSAILFVNYETSINGNMIYIYIYISDGIAQVRFTPKSFSRSENYTGQQRVTLVQTTISSLFAVLKMYNKKDQCTDCENIIYRECLIFLAIFGLLGAYNS